MTMTKFVEIRVGDVVWVGVRFNDSNGNEQVRRLYPSHKVGWCRSPGARLLDN